MKSKSKNGKQVDKQAIRMGFERIEQHFQRFKEGIFI